MHQSIFNYRKIRSITRMLYVGLGTMMPWFFAHAAVSITEVAWMGTTTSQYEEWVELYNESDDEVSLVGWKLIKSGGIPLIALTGAIPAQSYYLICRSTASLTSPLGGTCNEQGSFGGSGLNNTSDQLTLQDASGSDVESIDAGSGWPAGEASSKKTMQKSGNGWITASATAGSGTVSVPDDSSGGGSGNGDGGSENNTGDTEHDDYGSSQNPPSSSNSKEVIEKVALDPVYKATMIVPDFATTGVAIPMKAIVTKDKKLETLRGRFEWSMGDGGSYKFLKNIPIQHTFYYPGKYTVVMQYYSDIFREEPDTIHRKIITIVPDDLQILGYSTSDGLQIKNGADKEIALDGWIIQSNGQEFIFPKYTTIARGATLALSPRVLGIALSRNSLLLLNPSREVVAGYSYNYRAPDSDGEEVFVDNPDPQTISTQPPSNSLLEEWRTEQIPQSKTVSDIWNENKWYIVFGGVVLVVILAYLAFHLYAKQDEFI